MQRCGVWVFNMEILPLLVFFGQETVGEGCSQAVAPRDWEEQQHLGGIVG